MRAPALLLISTLLFAAPALHADGDAKDAGDRGHGQEPAAGRPDQAQKAAPAALRPSRHRAAPARTQAAPPASPRPQAQARRQQPRPKRAPAARTGVGAKSGQPQGIQGAAAVPASPVGRASQPPPHDRSAERAAGRAKLALLGVHSTPHRIDVRSSILQAPRSRSTMQVPQRGPEGRALPQHQVGLRQWQGAGLSARMDRLNAAPSVQAFGRMNSDESQRNRYYWHDDGGDRFCHFRDSWGQHWYGWYGGDSFFWVRNFDDRWWNYDAATGRWLYWNDGQWWWQDDLGGGGLYVFVNGDFILD